MVILVVFKGFLLAKNLEILIQIVPDCSIYYYYANTTLGLKNCAPFTKCNLEVNDEHADTAENLDITMPMYTLIEYSDNYQDSSATLYQYKRDEPPKANAVADLTADNSSSFKYKVSLLGNPVLDGNITKRRVKVVAPLKYLSNFFRSLEMPLINCKIKLNLTWKKECVLSNQDHLVYYH